MTPGYIDGQITVDTNKDRGTTFDGVKVGRPATGALVDAGYRTVADLPSDLHVLLRLHGVGPRAVEKLEAARREARPRAAGG